MKLWIGAHWPGVDPTRVGPWSWQAMFRPYLVILLPNVLFLGALFFGYLIAHPDYVPICVSARYARCS